MRNKALHRLNFNELLGYGGVVQRKHFYDYPANCDSFCVKCEKNGTLEKAGGKLTLMSHGCDTSDFEAAIGSVLPVSNPIDFPILFLLQDPGGDYDLGEEMSF